VIRVHRSLKLIPTPEWFHKRAPVASNPDIIFLDPGMASHLRNFGFQMSPGSWIAGAGVFSDWESVWAGKIFSNR
jgi:hypothetical protein